jgi:hypothetical protein
MTWPYSSSLTTGNIVLYRGRLSVIQKGEIEGKRGIFALYQDPIFPQHQKAAKLSNKYEYTWVARNKYELTDKDIKNARIIDSLREKQGTRRLIHLLRNDRESNKGGIKNGD